MKYCVRYSEYCKCLGCLKKKISHGDIMPVAENTFSNDLIQKSMKLNCHTIESNSMSDPVYIYKEDFSDRVVPLAEIYKESRVQRFSNDSSIKVGGRDLSYGVACNDKTRATSIYDEQE